ncbi:MAG: BatA domain-containing protein [Saprospiraceae bacterium]|nr:BatA domain-containing protein [Saprospiraceae bacterium]
MYSFTMVKSNPIFALTMQFLYPYFLWALVALTIPVIIHLFYFKRFKKVYFSNVRYLKEIKEETSNRNKIKELLILLSRLLAFACLIFAFAQPFIPKGEKIKQGLPLVSIFIDNSFSMTSEKEDIPLLDYAKEKALKIVDSYGEEGKFQIITHDLFGKHQRLLSKEDAVAYIEEIRFTALVQPLSKITARQNQLFKDEEGDKSFYHISDFQKSIFDYENVKDSVGEINLLPVQTAQLQNISIDSVWMDNHVAMMQQPNNLLVKMTNHAPQTTEQVRISILIDGQEKPIRVGDFEAGSTMIDTIPVVLKSRGAHKITLKISDYPVQFDDEYHVALHVPDTIIALNIYEGAPNKYLTALFEGLPYFGLKNQPFNQIQYQEFSKYNLIIIQDVSNITSGLSSELSKYIREGGKVLLFPSVDNNPVSYNTFLNSLNAGRLELKPNSGIEVSRINTEEFIFKDVYNKIQSNITLPKANKSFHIQNSSRNAGEPILTNRDGSLFMCKYTYEDGLLYLCASSLSENVNNLVLNAEIFVPMLYKMAISGVGQKKIAFTITNKSIIEIKNTGVGGDNVYSMKGENEFIPGQKRLGNKVLLDVGDQVKKAGFYDIMNGDQVLESVAFNYDRLESDMKLLTSDEMEENLGENRLGIHIISETEQNDMTNTISAKDKGISLWKYFLLAVLLFLMVETLLIRLWRTSS